MAGTKRIIRGLQDIRTHMGNINQSFVPYKAFMRLSCLEMEKFRRGNERSSAMGRVNNIDARFADIDIEKKAILEALNNAKIVNLQENPSESSRTNTSVQQKTGGFRFRY